MHIYPNANKGLKIQKSINLYPYRFLELLEFANSSQNICHFSQQ